MIKVRIGIIGCGTIGSFVAQKVDKELKPFSSIDALYDIEVSRAQQLFNELSMKPRVLFKLREVFLNSDLVVECASKDVVGEVLKNALRYRVHTVIMSVGGMLGRESFLKDFLDEGLRLYIPSGAIGGLDVLKAVRHSTIKELILTTYKPPQALTGAPYVIDNNIDLRSLKDDTVVFKGGVREAIEGFPQNINVAATIWLASGMFKKMKISIVASPILDKNIHHLLVRGEFGEVEFTCQNVPSSQNPKTSALAFLSCFSTVKDAVEDILVIKKQQKLSSPNSS